MTTRATFTVTIDIPTSRTADKMAAYIENMLDYLHATAKVVKPPEADPLHPMHNEGEEA